MKTVSALQTARYAYKPKLPAVLGGKVENLTLSFGKKTQAVSDTEELKKLFENTYGKPLAQVQKGKNANALKKIKAGVILSGGQAPGGHNVICGLYDAIKKGNADSVLLGFLGGPSGLLENKFIKFTDKIIDEYRNTGGFDIIGSGRTKIETDEQ